MSTYTPDGVQLEGPVIMSNGEYKLREDVSGYKGCPLADYGSADSDDHNKRWCTNYGDSNGISGVIGFPMEDKLESGNADVDRVGRGGRRRDIAMFHQGIYEVPYQGTTNPLPALRPIAPHPRGFQEWSPGMFHMGYTLTYCWTGEVDNKVFITCLGAPQFKYVTDTINFGLSTNVASGLSFTPTEILSLTVSGVYIKMISGAAAGVTLSNTLRAQDIPVYISGVELGNLALTSGSAMWKPSTKYLYIHGDQAAATGYVRYKYWDGV